MSNKKPKVYCIDCKFCRKGLLYMLCSASPDGEEEDYYRVTKNYEYCKDINEKNDCKKFKRKRFSFFDFLERRFE